MMPKSRTFANHHADEDEERSCLQVLMRALRSLVTIKMRGKGRLWQQKRIGLAGTYLRNEAATCLVWVVGEDWRYLR